jgi:hypothetical protein
MKWSIPAILFCISTTGTSGFMSQATKSGSSIRNLSNSNERTLTTSSASTTSASRTIRSMATVDAEAETATHHDVVKVDLSDGRDYPIYIGAEFDDKKGTNDYK